MTAFAAAGASAEPVQPSEGTAKIEEKAVSAAVKISPRPGRRSTVVTAAEIYERQISLQEQKGRQPSYVALVRENRENEKRRKGAHPKPSPRGGAPAHPSEHRESVRNDGKPGGPDKGGTAIIHVVEAARSTVVLFLGRLWRKRDRRSVFPLARSLRYSVFDDPDNAASFQAERGSVSL